MAAEDPSFNTDMAGKVNNPIQGIKGLIAGMSISGSSLSDINSIPDIHPAYRPDGRFVAGTNPYP